MLPEQDIHSLLSTKMKVMVILPLVCLVMASQAQKICVSSEDQMAICHKGNAMGKKADAAMSSCAAQLGMERSLGRLAKA